MSDITKYQKRLIEHSLGNKTMYRNYFVASNGHVDIEELRKLCELGYMFEGATPTFAHPDDIVFHVTQKGREIAFKDE